ncbi:MAG: hypothetical protein QF903_07765 [Planctomycetota bacterium]|jgi:hypothetical protein|nr:hypothetical protein [Planctomycetota bacterium]MDP6762757.1 hypothetical protein [Planctomycetota bacterium]MDP6989362.1 hypothetical protein [Planctomycetota bacterium]
MPPSAKEPPWPSTAPEAWEAGERVAARAGCDLASLSASIGERAVGLGTKQAQALRYSLWEDIASEYDARFLGAWLAGLDIEYSAPFQSASAVWEQDELGHHACSKRAFVAAFGGEGDLDRRLALRRPDFAPLASFFVDEFTILCLLAYDELATVRAYRANLPLYAHLGRPFLRLMHRIMADEARHYASFLSVARTEHAARAPEAAGVIARLRAAGVPYAATFVLDHDDPVFTPKLLDETAATLCAQLAG